MIPAEPSPRSHRTLALRIAIAIAAVLAALLVVLAAFPWGAFKDHVARSLSASLGQRVTIASASRTDAFSLVPTLRIEGLRIAQPAWAGTGLMAAVDGATIRFPVIPLLFGHVHVHALAIDGVHLDLRRDAAGRANWEHKGHGGGGGLSAIRSLTISRGTLRMTDLGRQMTLTGTIAASPTAGFTVSGRGTHRGLPMELRFAGGRIDAAGAGHPYPFALHLSSALLAIDGTGTMRRTLDIDHFTAQLKASGRDLTYFDDAIQAGLPATQDFALNAAVVHDGQSWTVERLAGTIGRSALEGHATVDKRAGRTIIDATIAASRFDFDDLDSDAALARADAMRAKLGARLIPATQIHLDHLARTDGTLRFTAAQILSKTANPFRTLAATLTLDHRVLTADPLVATLPHGRVTGRARVDDRTGSPHLTIDLTLTGGEMTDIFTHQTNLAGPLTGRARLAGIGRTVRDALAKGSGSIGLVSRNGTMAKRIAVLASGDVLKSAGEAIGGDGGDRVPLRCMAARFAGSGGRLVAGPLVFDTSIMRADGTGAIDLDGERLDFSIDGRPRKDALLSVKPTVQVTGTILDPKNSIATTAGHHGLLAKAGQILGHLHIGKSDPQPMARPADCAALSAKALG